MKKLEDIPNEVFWAQIVINTSQGVGIDTYEEVEKIIAKYPEYFPWETKYNSIPKEVHIAYLDEKYPDRNKPIVCINDGRGIYQQINENPFEYRQYTFKEIIEFLTDWDKNIVTKKEQAKKLWDKHYKKYNLEFRE